MSKLSTYFVAAFKAEVVRGPRGTQARLARAANIAPGQVTDILKGRKFGTEETKRALASALGWDYEEFLKYGRCLLEGREYKRPELKAPAYDPSLYLSVPFYTKIKAVAGPGGKTPAPDDSEIHPPLLLFKPSLGKYAKSRHLAAFNIYDDSMEPTLPKQGTAIIDTADRDVNDGKLFLLAQNPTSEKYLIKRLRRDGDELYLISDNSKYPPKVLMQPWDKIVVGRVVWSWLPQT
jgi:Predicted transcriptional regulator